MALKMEITHLTNEKPTTLSKYESLGAAMAAELMIVSALELEPF